MSWPQRGSAPPPERAPYHHPAQNFSNQQNMYPNYQAPSPGNMQQQYWQQNPQYNQQLAQPGYQQEYANNANQFYQQQTPQYNQNYTNPGNQYTNNSQGYPQGYYQNQPLQQNFQPGKKSDGWEDNWDWGWDESAKQGQAGPKNASQAQPPQQQPAFNNANVIEESFTSTNTWNWSVEDKKDANIAAPPPVEPAMLPVSPQEAPASDCVAAQKSATHVSNQDNEEIRNLGDRDVVKERLPNLALGKRFHLDNLTPQWSIESQMSQESSDGPQTHSEGTYRSENQSRNSSKSSPGLNTDNSNFNYSHSGLEECSKNTDWSRHSNDELTLTDNAQNSSRRESHEELSNALQDMNIANKETTSDALQASRDVRSLHDAPATLPPPSTSPSNYHVPPMSGILPPPPPLSLASIPPPTQVSSTSLPPPPTGGAIPPPTGFPVSSSSTNPFKQSGPFSHKKAQVSGSASIQSFPTPTSAANLSSASAVNMTSQHRTPVGFGANLETTPDNSERPDQPQMSAFRPMPLAQSVPENLEVAPQNDRNEYLQTEHLSSSDFGENTDFSRNAPPPGLRRMVVGQQESEYNQSLNMSGDEPPPGLARMVPGQQTEADNNYNVSYDRHIDGQPTENSGRQYRQADGQTTPDNFTQPPTNRGQERRPLGFDRMVPGESNNEYSQYQPPNYGSANDQRVVMGVDHDYQIPSDVREQNMDGSDYSEQTPRTVTRNVIGARDGGDAPQDFPSVDDHQREVTMEGENLEDLSAISSGELGFSRDQTLEGADIHANDLAADRKTDLSDSMENHAATSSRRQSINHGTSGDESDRDKAFKASPRRDRDRHKSTRDRERDKEGRYSRGERSSGKYEREPERRSAREERRAERRERRDSPDARRRRGRDRRYETEDTDYYSDRERDRRRYREGSYASKPPRPDKSRPDERDRARRYNTIERDRVRRDDRERERDRDRERDRYRYRDIDPTRKYGNIKRDEEERRRVVTFSGDDGKSSREGETYSGGSRGGSREGLATDEEEPERRRERRPRHQRSGGHYRDRDYYDGGYMEATYRSQYESQRAQYEYYERLRRTDPAAYMLLYKQLMAAPHAAHDASFGSVGYEGRGSVHSGRSSTNGLKGNDTYFGLPRAPGSLADGSLRDAPSLRTDLSDRDLNTDVDASLNLQLEESTVRSERMTPCKFSTAHIKGSIGSQQVVVVRPSYPVDGLPATVQILSLSAALAHDPTARELANYPGPLVKGVTHKKSVIEYCEWRLRSGTGAPERDAVGRALLWQLLILLLRQNGVVVGADLAELLVENVRQYEHRTKTESRRGSSVSGQEESRGDPSPDHASAPDLTPVEEPLSLGAAVDERAAIDKFRDYLTYGNRQDALEWAMRNKLWGHALSLSAQCERRVRAQVAARFLSALPAQDPLHTLYAHLAAKQPPVATCAADARWGDWRPHAAIMLANTSAKPDQDRRTLTLLGDRLMSRGLTYSAQFCYISAGLPFARHPAAPLSPPAREPPRLALLMADARANTLQAFATNQAIFATEIYEYALSLNQDYVITELQVYKFVLATRLADCGEYARALAYTEAAARALTRSPHDYSPAFLAQLAALADRLRYQEPALAEEAAEGDSGEPSPRHQLWLDQVTLLAQQRAVSSHESTPQHQPHVPHVPHQTYQPVDHPPEVQASYGWGDQPQQVYQPPPVEPEETPDYYQQHLQQQQQQQPPQPYAEPEQDYGYSEPHQYADPQYGWQQDPHYGYSEPEPAPPGPPPPPAAELERPMITMPGAKPYQEEDDRPPSADHTDRETDTPSAKPAKPEKGGGEKGGGGGWLGGILTKLSLRPPNQMILPDDKNPTIVWDAEHRRWRNTDGDDEPAPAPPPPPTMQALPPASAAGAGEGPPLASHSTSNIFKMQKSRHIKKSYVDVFNPSGASMRPLPPAAEVLGPAPAPVTSHNNYFVPAPTHHNDPGLLDPPLSDRDDYHSGI